MNQTVFVSLQLHRERSWLISTNLFDSSVFLLTVVQLYIHSAYMEGTPHPKPHTHPLFLFFLIYIYIRSTTSRSKKHLVPLGLVVTTLTERHIKAPSIQPAETRRVERQEGEERKSGTNSVSHTHRNLSLLMEKLQRPSAPLLRESINLHTLTASLTDCLAPTLISFPLLRLLAQSLMSDSIVLAEHESY